MYGGECVKASVAKPEVKRPLVRPRLSWKKKLK
jgi:hypothetical protein